MELVDEKGLGYEDRLPSHSLLLEDSKNKSGSNVRIGSEGSDELRMFRQRAKRKTQGRAIRERSPSQKAGHYFSKNRSQHHWEKGSRGKNTREKHKNGREREVQQLKVKRI